MEAETEDDTKCTDCGKPLTETELEIFSDQCDECMDAEDEREEAYWDSEDGEELCEFCEEPLDSDGECPSGCTD